MKRTLNLIFLACGASLMLGAAAQAQTASPTAAASPSCSPGAWGGHHKHGHGGLLERLTYALSLSGSQQAEIAPIIEQAKPQLKTIHDSAQTQRAAVFNTLSTQITPLLTPDQQTKFAEVLQKLENPGPGPRSFAEGGGPAGSRGPQGDVLQRLTSELGLTTDQQSQIKPILDAAHAQVQTIRQNTSLTQDQKFAQIKDTMEAAHGQINGILTPAQQQQLAAMKDQFHHGHGPGSRPAASPSPTTD